MNGREMRMLNKIYKDNYQKLKIENKRLKETLQKDRDEVYEEIEAINEQYLTEIFMLQYKINKAIDYINEELDKNKNTFSVVNDYNIFLDGMERAYNNCLEILGDKET